MILPWAHSLISAGAHGLRRIPGQSVNLAHPLFGAHHAPRPLCLRAKRCTPAGFPRGAMGVGDEKPLQSLRDSFPTSGEAACPNCFRLPLPHSWGSSGEAGEGVFPPGSALVPILVKQGVHQNGAKGKGIWPLKRRSLRSCTLQPLDEETW